LPPQLVLFSCSWIWRMTGPSRSSLWGRHLIWIVKIFQEMHQKLCGHSWDRHGAILLEYVQLSIYHALTLVQETFRNEKTLSRGLFSAYMWVDVARLVWILPLCEPYGIIFEDVARPFLDNSYLMSLYPFVGLAKQYQA